MSPGLSPITHQMRAPIQPQPTRLSLEPKVESRLSSGHGSPIFFPAPMPSHHSFSFVVALAPPPRGRPSQIEGTQIPLFSFPAASPTGRYGHVNLAEPPSASGTRGPEERRSTSPWSPSLVSRMRSCCLRTTRPSQDVSDEPITGRRQNGRRSRGATQRCEGGCGHQMEPPAPVAVAEAKIDEP